jgi:hypothetical protein
MALDAESAPPMSSEPGRQFQRIGVDVAAGEPGVHFEQERQVSSEYWLRWR